VLNTREVNIWRRHYLHVLHSFHRLKPIAQKLIINGMEHIQNKL
jgi:hypothetical protein